MLLRTHTHTARKVQEADMQVLGGFESKTFIIEVRTHSQSSTYATHYYSPFSTNDWIFEFLNFVGYRGKRNVPHEFGGDGGASEKCVLIHYGGLGFQLDLQLLYFYCFLHSTPFFLLLLLFFFLLLLLLFFFLLLLLFC
jgi:hypothetical protein